MLAVPHAQPENAPAQVADKKVARLPEIQFVRAVAATLVLLGHAQSNTLALAKQVGAEFAPVVTRFSGGLGVDLFFLVSGFVMVVSSANLFGRPGSPLIFLKRRLIRIVPLYYAATLFYLPIYLFGSHAPAGSVIAAAVTTFFFLPYPTYGFDGDNVFPIFSLGWSLNYEMFFYAVFAAALLFRKAVAIVAMPLILVCAVFLGQFIPGPNVLRFWTQPIILEFAIGFAIALVWSRAEFDFSGFRRAALPVSIAMIVMAVSIIVIDPFQLMEKIGYDSTPNDFKRVLGWGAPATLIVIAMLMQRWQSLSFASRVAEHLGNCSYSLYLTHPFCLIALKKIWLSAGISSNGGFVTLLILSVALSFLVAHLVYSWFELPVTAKLRQLSGG